MQVDLDTRRVVLEDGSVLDYDDLVVATGATAGFFGITGADEQLASAVHARRRATSCGTFSSGASRTRRPDRSVTTVAPRASSWSVEGRPESRPRARSSSFSR